MLARGCAGEARGCAGEGHVQARGMCRRGACAVDRHAARAGMDVWQERVGTEGTMGAWMGGALLSRRLVVYVHVHVWSHALQSSALPCD